VTTYDYVVADVFCSAALEGNPLAVFTDAGDLDATTMQRLARELNLSETVFLVGDVPDGADVRARIFTPGAELPFAGHPVLGTAFVVGRARGLETVRIATGAGIVPVALTREDDTIVSGEMEQPIPRWELMPEPTVQLVLAALGVTESALPVEIYDLGPRHCYIALASKGEVAALRPDLQALAAAGGFGVACIHADGSDRVHARVFHPGVGVPEDPATGSAAGPLAVHLARHGVTRFGQRIQIDQGVEIARPSRLEAMAEGSGDDITRVAVGGGAVIVAEGRFSLSGCR
jgi:trans-2,3-dihydro-3-hydroxyanthranilate isomerase